MTTIEISPDPARHWAAYLRAKGKPGERNEYQALIDLLDPPEKVPQGIRDLIYTSTGGPPGVERAATAIVKYLVDRVEAMDEINKSDVWEPHMDDRPLVTKDSVVDLLRGVTTR